MDQAEGLRRLAADPHRPTQKNLPVKEARVIAITSGKGGVGKTHLAVNLSIALAEAGLRVGLLDADLGLANVDILMGITPKYTLADVIFGEKRLEQTGIMGPAGVLVYPGGTGLTGLANVSEGRLGRFLDEMTTLDSQLDMLLIDTAAGIGQGVTAFLAAATELIVVTTPEPTSITDAYAVVKTVGHNNPQTTMHLVVNKARSQREAESVCRNLNLILRRFSVRPVTLQLLGYLPFEAGVTRAIIDQVPIVISQPNSHIARSVREMADRLRGSVSPARGGVAHLFHVLAQRLRRDE